MTFTDSLQILSENIKFSKEIYSNGMNDSKKMVNQYRKTAGKLLGANIATGDSPHALDTYAGGPANLFLESPRSQYANRVMGNGWKDNIDYIEPGKKHKLNLVVHEKDGSTANLDDFLKKHGEKLNKSKCKVR